jgi:hypothetical protein
VPILRGDFEVSLILGMMPHCNWAPIGPICLSKIHIQVLKNIGIRGFIDGIPVLSIKNINKSYKKVQYNIL